MADIDSLLQEDRLFPPPADFSVKALIPDHDTYDKLVERAENDPDTFWAEIASELHWFTSWKQVLDWKPPFSKWFVGATTNLAALPG